MAPTKNLKIYLGILFSLALLGCFQAPAFSADNATEFAVLDSGDVVNDRVMSNYEIVRDTSLSILRSYPVNQTWFIGVGRSPVPVIAFFQELGILNTGNLPLSKMNKFDATGNDLGKLREVLDTHFARFLPSPEELNRRGIKQIVLIDYASGGGGISNSATEIQHFLNKHSYKTDLKVAALCRNENVCDDLAAKGYKIFNAHTAMVYSQYDEHAEYGTFVAGVDDSATLMKRPEYIQFRSTLKAKMLGDPLIKVGLPPEFLSRFDESSLHCNLLFHGLVK